MGLFRDFILGQPLDKKEYGAEPKEEKEAVAEKVSKWVSGKSYSVSDFMKLVGEDDHAYHRMFTTGEFGQHREALTKKLEEIVAAKKKSGGTFNKEDAGKIARELATHSDPVSRLLSKAINNTF